MLAAGSILGLDGCDRTTTDELRVAGPTMGTRYEVRVPAPPAGLTAPALEVSVRTLLDRVVAQMSTYEPGSELSRFNRSTGTGWHPVSPELAFVTARALRVSELTAGAFDVTVGPLVEAWGFGAGASAGPAIPSDAALESAMARVGWRALAVDEAGGRLRKSVPDLEVDLSAIAKGYAVDMIATYLERLGAERYLVEIGGELRVKGPGPRDAHWRIAIERPDPGRRNALAVLHLRQGAVATSGDYRNYFELDGVRYSHTLDPATGRPVRHHLASVTVVHPEASFADAIATALLVLGPERGPHLAESIDLAAYFISREADGVHMQATSRMAPFLRAEGAEARCPSPDAGACPGSSPLSPRRTDR